MRVERQAWTDAAADVLRPALGSDGATVRAMVEQGLAILWRLGTLYMVTRREGAELVVMCIAGAGLRQATPLIIAAARRAGCQSIRFHTQRPALGRMLARYGFIERERVFAMEVA